METTHVLEPAFRIVPEALVSGQNRPRKTGGIPAAQIAGGILISLLERLHLCHAPRIVNAECLACELPPATGVSGN